MCYTDLDTKDDSRDVLRVYFDGEYLRLKKRVLTVFQKHRFNYKLNFSDIRRSNLFLRKYIESVTYLSDESDQM